MSQISPTFNASGGGKTYRLANNLTIDYDSVDELKSIWQDQIAANKEVMEIVAASQETMELHAKTPFVMDAVSASATAMNAVVGSTTAMDAVAGSATAMNAVAGSDTAMNAVVGSTTAIDAVSGSAVARDSVFNSSNPITQPSETNLFDISGTGFEDDPYSGISQNQGQDGTTAFVDFSVNFDGTVHWDMTVSSEDGFDKARVKKNSNTLAEISGKTSSASSTSVLSGDTMRVEYQKDGSNSDDDDQVTLNSLYWSVN